MRSRNISVEKYHVAEIIRQQSPGMAYTLPIGLRQFGWTTLHMVGLPAKEVPPAVNATIQEDSLVTIQAHDCLVESDTRLYSMLAFRS